MATGTEETESHRGAPRRLLLLNFAALFGIGAFEVAVPLAARGPLNLGGTAISLLFVECAAVMIAAQGVLIAAHERERMRVLLAGGFVAYGAGLLLLAGAASGVSTFLAVGLIAAGSGIVLPVIGYLATFEAGMAAGAVLGTLTAAGSLGQAIGSAAGGIGYAVFGPQAFMMIAFAMGIGAVLGARCRHPRTTVGDHDHCPRT